MSSFSLSLPLPGTARRTAFGKIVLNEARLAWRRPVGLIGGLGIPVLLLVIFGELPAFQQPAASLGRIIAPPAKSASQLADAKIEDQRMLVGIHPRQRGLATPGGPLSTISRGTARVWEQPLRLASRPA